jgi:4-amino-4-deoxy-L-arabinose transferase-like glycosyltransferase
VRARTSDALAVFALALVVRLAFVVAAHAHFPAVEDGHYYDVLAHRLASGAGYTWLWPDGAVTYAAHYPVGYPALLALFYFVFGASPAVAMTLHALLGAASAYGGHRLVDGDEVARWRPLAAGIAIAVHPALVPYTAAFMTEGVTASILVVAGALANAARKAQRSSRWIASAGIAMGAATLVRPQSLILAPILGALAAAAGAGARVRVARAFAVTAVALACLAPWTARNCARMHSCALVSVNGGWNLLIGAQTDRGGWEPVGVPPECATVWDEAAKDACFGRAAKRRIASRPVDWLARVPAKLAVTFDYFGAAPWYLHASNPEAFGEGAKRALGSVETIVCRLLLLVALVTGGRWRGRRPVARKVVALVGAAGAVTLHGWIGYVAIAACVAMAGRRAAAAAPMVLPAAAAIIGATAAVHSVFFGAGRYGLIVVPFVTMVAFLGDGRKRGSEAMMV